jgi:hypothetical protein
MVRDLSRHVGINLVDVAIENDDAAERIQKLYRFGSVGCVPVPVGGEVEKRAVSENYNPGVFVEFFEVAF